GLTDVSFPVEPEIEFLRDYLLPVADSNPNHTYRLRVRASRWTHDARGCQCVIDIERIDCSLHHLSDGMLAHRAISNECLFLHSQQVHLNFVCIADHAAFEIIRRTGNGS